MSTNELSQNETTPEPPPVTSEGGGGSKTTVDQPGWTPPETDPGPDR
jgi:hypothetical protein